MKGNEKRGRDGKKERWKIKEGWAAKEKRTFTYTYSGFLACA